MSSLSRPVWSHPYVRTTHVDAFRRQINRKYGTNISKFPDLHKWSLENLEQFCGEVWDFAGLIYSQPPTKVANGIESMWPRPEWFPGALLNYSENMLHVGLSAYPDSVAVVAYQEKSPTPRDFTWKQLYEETELYVSAMRAAGVKKNDRVAACATNSFETLILLLATGAIGAVFSTTSPEMGLGGILERFVQIRPKLLFVDTEVFYGGKDLDMRDKMASVVEGMRARPNELEKVITVQGRAFKGKDVTTLSEFIKTPRVPLQFEQVPFDHPIYILYSSGTTGPPKCICHAGGAAILQQKKELLLQANMGPRSIYYQYSTTGWMMWNYLAAGLSVGARIVLYDGSPLHPSPAHQLQLVKEQGVTHWGTSPKFLAGLKQSLQGPVPKLEALQFVLASGSPLSEELYAWIYGNFEPSVGLFSGSGGTDLVGGIVGGNCLLPVYKGQISGDFLGMSVEVWDDDGKNITSTGEKGDLVITKPFFSMPLTFWGENGMEKYREAYFDKFPGIWHHGDFIRWIPETGGYEILGRSDGVLNPGGVRFGTAELYGVIDKFKEIEDCIAVGQKRSGESDEQVLMFLKIKQGGKLDDGLQTRIKQAIRSSLSPRHVPAYILQVADIPYTANGKKIENLVKDVVSGRKAKIGGTAVNPECLEEYKGFVDLPRADTVKAKL